MADGNNLETIVTNKPVKQIRDLIEDHVLLLEVTHQWVGQVLLPMTIMVHGMVEDASGARENLAHKHCRVHHDWLYSTCNFCHFTRFSPTICLPSGL